MWSAAGERFLYRSPSDGVFFVNIRFLFNGERLAFVKSFHFKDAAARQQELPLTDGPAVGERSGLPS